MKEYGNGRTWQGSPRALSLWASGSLPCSHQCVNPSRDSGTELASAGVWAPHWGLSQLALKPHQPQPLCSCVARSCPGRNERCLRQRRLLCSWLARPQLYALHALLAPTGYGPGVAGVTDGMRARQVAAERPRPQARDAAPQGAAHAQKVAACARAVCGTPLQAGLKRMHGRN